MSVLSMALQVLSTLAFLSPSVQALCTLVYEWTYDVYYWLQEYSLSEFISGLELLPKSELSFHHSFTFSFETKFIWLQFTLTRMRKC